MCWNSVWWSFVKNIAQLFTVVRLGISMKAISIFLLLTAASGSCIQNQWNGKQNVWGKKQMCFCSFIALHFNSWILNLMLSNSNRCSGRKRESGAEKMIKINPIPLHNTQQKITNVKWHQTTLEHRAELTSHTMYVKTSPPPPPPPQKKSRWSSSFIYYQNTCKKTC